MNDSLSPEEERVIQKTLMRTHEQGWGISLGLLSGLTLFVATIVLVARGGRSVGQHLGLLSIYFPGYSVSLVGSVIGFIYAFVIGYGAGRLVASTYNRLTDDSH